MEETAASDEQTLNRKRGRPRKSEPPEQQQEQREQREQPSSKRTRARGRPRKSDIQDDAIASADVSTPQSQTTSPAAVVTTMIPPDPVPHDPTLNSTSDIDSIGIPNDLENKKQKQPRPRGRPRKYKTKEEYQEAGKQYRLAHKARKSMLAEGTIRLAPAVNGVGDDDETDEDSVLDDDSVVPEVPKPSRNAKQIPLDTGIDETMEDHAHEEPSNAQLLRRHDSLERLHTQLQSDFAGQRRTTASCFVEIETLRKRIEEQDEQIATLRGEFASLKNYNIAIIRQREAS